MANSALYNKSLQSKNKPSAQRQSWTARHTVDPLNYRNICRIHSSSFQNHFLTSSEPPPVACTIMHILVNALQLNILPILPFLGRIQVSTSLSMSRSSRSSSSRVDEGNGMRIASYLPFS